MGDLVERAKECIPRHDHFWSLPDIDGIRQCLWCNQYRQEAIADMQAKARDALEGE